MTLFYTINEKVKAAFAAALAAEDTGFITDFKAIQVIQELEFVDIVNSRRIVLGAKAVPEIAGAAVIGWEVDLTVQCITHFKKWTKAQHDEICGPVEALIFDISGLPARLTNSALKVQVATPDPVQSDYQEEERITEYHVKLDCFLTGGD